MFLLYSVLFTKNITEFSFVAAMHIWEHFLNLCSVTVPGNSPCHWGRSSIWISAHKQWRNCCNCVAFLKCFLFDSCKLEDINSYHFSFKYKLLLLQDTCLGSKVSALKASASVWLCPTELGFPHSFLTCSPSLFHAGQPLLWKLNDLPDTSQEMAKIELQ